MMQLFRRRRLLEVVFVLVAIALVAGGIAIKKGSFGTLLHQPGQELMYFPSGRFLRESSLGNETMLADIVWLRAIQYYGHHRLTDRKYDMVGHIFDIVTTLDPNFIHAYVFGALVLAQDAGKPYEGIALLRKGMRHNPDNWLLAFEVGFIYYIVLSDYKSAGHYFSLASKLPGAPDFPSRFAAFVEERAGNTETALKLWMEVADATPNKYIKEMAQEKIERLNEQLEKERKSAGLPKQG